MAACTEAAVPVQPWRNCTPRAINAAYTRRRGDARIGGARGFAAAGLGGTTVAQHGGRLLPQHYWRRFAVGPPPAASDPAHGSAGVDAGSREHSHVAAVDSDTTEEEEEARSKCPDKDRSQRGSGLVRGALTRARRPHRRTSRSPWHSVLRIIIIVHTSLSNSDNAMHMVLFMTL